MEANPYASPASHDKRKPRLLSGNLVYLLLGLISFIASFAYCFWSDSNNPEMPQENAREAASTLDG